MHTITSIKAERIKDSRDVPTLLVTVTTDNGATGVCMVPSGASTGKYEAYELRDGGTGHGDVTKALELVNTTIQDTLVGKGVSDQKEIDRLLCELDGTSNKRILGGNSTLGVSVACGKAAAHSEGREFFEYLRGLREIPIGSVHPLLYFNLINGGKHTATKLAFQEYHIVPQVDSVYEALQIAQKIQDTLGKIITERYGEVSKGDEGGYALPTENIREPLELLREVVEVCNLKDKIMYALDVAATSFYDDATSMYTIGEETHAKEELHTTYVALSEEFPILSIEDPFYEEDFESFALLQAALPDVVIVGDDLTVTNINRVRQAVQAKSITGLIIKPNQIGSLTETIDTIYYAHNNDIKCIVSHRSGETLDDMIADIVTAFHTFGIKSGARGQEVREVKYKRLSVIQK